MPVRAHHLLASRVVKSEVYQSHSADLLASQHTFVLTYTMSWVLISNTWVGTESF